MTVTINQNEPTILKGLAASPGIAIGPVYIHRKFEPVINETKLETPEIEAEIDRLKDAIARSYRELSKILEFARTKLGDDQAKILEAQTLILQDNILLSTLYRRVKKEHRNAESIVYEEIGKYYHVMLAAKDEYTRERAQDVEDVRHRILRNLQEKKLTSRLENACIIVAHSLTPADTLIFSRNDVLGYASDVGGITSHTAILSRALKIPAVVGLHELAIKLQPKDQLILCGYSGTIIVNPTPQQIADYREKLRRHQAFEANLVNITDLPAETLDGHRVTIQANVELTSELDFVKSQGADGIGLFRSEVLLFGREDFPSEDEQFETYSKLVREMNPRQVIIRTFDIGGDKVMIQSVHERNPFLGWRGIRILLDKEDLFLEQLRAILRAGVDGNLGIMFPMVTSVNEVRRAKQLLEKAKNQLRERGVPFGNTIQIGVMVEVPAAAVIADFLAREVDFFSIGSNDLIQYLLAVDRDNDLVADLYQEFHPAIIRFIRRIIERGSKGKVWVGMCGEMAGNPATTILLLGLGLQEFSVTPNILPEIKKIIRSVQYSEAVEIAHIALEMETAEEIKAYMESVLRGKFPELPID